MFKNHKTRWKNVIGGKLLKILRMGYGGNT
nr:MAG TPA: hypothetical protein [Caudoviricetes sp.]